MLKKFLLPAVFVSGFLVISCGTKESHNVVPEMNESLAESLGNVVARPLPSPLPVLMFRPELQFTSKPVYFEWGSGHVSVAAEALIKIPCSATTVRVKFEYKNAGIVGAGAHHSRGYVTFNGSDVRSQPALAAGAMKTDFMSLPIGQLPVNQVETVRIYLDNQGEVVETSETNNLFQARIVKVCP